MLNEFLKSLFRTLGRIFAYFLLGFIVFYLFSIYKVNASTIDANEYYIQSFNRQGTIQEDTIGTQLSDYNDAVGFNIFPVSNGQYVSISASDYYINIRFQIAVEFDYFSYNVKPDIKLTFGNIDATCDGSEFFQLSEKVRQYGQMYYTYDYTCTQLIVTQTFNQIRLQIVSPNWLDQVNVYPVQLFMRQMEFLDSNELNTDTGQIVDRIDDQTTIIVNNNNSNTQTIVENNNSNTTRITDKQDITNQKLDNINNSLIDNSPPNIQTFNNISNYQPSSTPLTDIIALPLTIINNEINGLNGVCQPWTFTSGPLLGRYNIVLPCLDMRQYFSTFTYEGYDLWQLIDFMCCLFMGYQILMLIISAYNDISSLNDTFHTLYTPTTYWANPGKVYYS